MCVFVSACVCVCPCSCCRLCCFCPYGRGEGGFYCFQFDIKVQDIAKCRSGLSEHFSKVRKFFPSLFLLHFFFFFASPHNVTPSTIKCTFVCVCVSLIYLCLFLRLSHKMSSQKASSTKLFVCCRVVNCRRPLQLFLVLETRDSFCICLII